MPETLSDDILAKMHAPQKKGFPIANRETLTKYDAFLFGIPTRFGNMPAQMKVRPFLFLFFWAFVLCVLTHFYLLNIGILGCYWRSLESWCS